MLNAARVALSHVGRMSKDDFREDIKTQDAVLRRLAILGEAGRRVSDDFKRGHPEVDWSGAIRARDKVTHGYDVVNLDRIWEIIQDDLPGLIRLLEPLVSEEPQ
ncbi:MAG: DUF86 domain-containing protein [Actinomycetota bacterium]